MSTIDDLNAEFRKEQKNKTANDGIKKYFLERKHILLFVLIGAATLVFFFSLAYRHYQKPPVQEEQKVAVSAESKQDSSTADPTTAASKESTSSADVSFSASESDSTTEYPDILTEDERKEWKTKEKSDSEVYIQLNTRIGVQGNGENAYIRLINPPYSEYDFKIKAYLKSDSNDILYESAVISPGTILEYVKLEHGMEAGEYDAVIQYTFYKDDSEIGTQEQAVTFVVS